MFFLPDSKKCHQFTNQIAKEENLHLTSITSSMLQTKKNLALSLDTLHPLFPVLLT